MSAAILIFVFIGILHFVIEFIVAPQVRQEILFDAYRLRHEVRLGAHTFAKQMPAGQYQIVRSEAESFCHVFPRVGVVALMRMSAAIRKDRELRTLMQQRIAQVDAIKQPEARRILNRLAHCGRRALAMNTAGWFLYLAPLVLVSRCVGWARRALARLMAAPRDVLDRIAPDPKAAI